MEGWKVGLITGVIAFFVTQRLQIAVILGLTAFGSTYL